MDENYYAPSSTVRSSPPTKIFDPADASAAPDMSLMCLSQSREVPRTVACIPENPLGLEPSSRVELIAIRDQIGCDSSRLQCGYFLYLMVF